MANVQVLGKQPAELDHAENEQKKERRDERELDQARATLPPLM